MNEDERKRIRTDARLDRIARWIETWHEIRYFGKALGKLGEWIIRILISAWLVVEIWNRVFGK